MLPLPASPPKAHSRDIWDLLPPAATTPGSAYLDRLQIPLVSRLRGLQLVGIAALERRVGNEEAVVTALILCVPCFLTLPFLHLAITRSCL